MNFQPENASSGQYYATVTDAITALQQKGFTLDFCLLDNQVFCPQLKLFLRPDEFEILEMHLFDAVCCARDENIVYAISCVSINPVIKSLLPWS
jgi:hypothetical protein